MAPEHFATPSPRITSPVKRGRDNTPLGAQALSLRANQESTYAKNDLYPLLDGYRSKKLQAVFSQVQRIVVTRFVGLTFTAPALTI